MIEEKRSDTVSVLEQVSTAIFRLISPLGVKLNYPTITM